MSEQSFLGVWNLAGAFSINGELDIDPETEEGKAELADWLFGHSHDDLDLLTDASGLQLTIHNNATFTERKTADPQVTWFDAEGVQDDDVVPFDGVYTIRDGKAYLTLAEPPEWATSADRKRIRYDDGDTVVCDSLEIVGGNLIRTISVTSDGAYLDRVVLQYKGV